MRRSALLVVVVLGVATLAAGCGGGESPEPQYRGLVVEDQPLAPDFTLRDQHGRAVSMADQRGRWSMVTFLYTQCPDVCPAIAGNLNAAIRTPAGRRAGLHVLVVSVDPERDTLPTVRRYARQHRFVPGFHWLIGNRAQLQRVWRAYGVAVLPGPKETVSHSTFQLLVDPEGHLRLVYDATVQTADVVHDLRLLENEG